MRKLYSTALASLMVILLSFSGLKGYCQPTAQSLPYKQDFSSLAANSSTYPSGWQGYNSSTSIGSSYSTASFTTTTALTQSGDASLTSSAVYNYNGKIGFLSTGGGNNQALVLAINTTGFSNVSISYSAMTIRNPNNYTHELTLQYRIGTSGTYTDASPSTFYQNNTTTQTTAVTTPQNQVDNILVTLPAACDNQAVVQLRWIMRTSAGNSGSRPSMAIDNIVVGQANTLTFSSVGSNQITLNWNDGAGTKRAIFIAATSSGTVSPAANTTYTANLNFSSGSQIGSTGWYCVYNGNASHTSGIVVTGLTASTPYRVMVCEYTGSAGSESYLSNTAYNNPANQTSAALVVTAPTVTTNAASSITTTGATLNGTVSANNASTTVTFNSGLTASYGTTTAATPSPLAANATNSAVSATISALSVNTQYNFRVSATNSAGTTNGSNLIFYTLANVTAAPTLSNATTTTLDLAINANGNPANTTYSIEENSGQFVQADGTLGAMEVYQTAAAWYGAGSVTTVYGLTSNTQYTFKVNAKNGDGVKTAGASTAAITTLSSGCTSPSVQPTSFNSNTIAGVTANIAFTRGDGDQVIVLARAGGAVNSTPVSGSSYTANSAFGSGSQIGSGNYVIYSGTAAGASAATGNIAISGLTKGTTYYFAAYEWNNTSTCYNTVSPLTGNFTTVADPTIFTTVAASGITEQSASSGGQAITAGGGNISAKGVVWNTSVSPTLPGLGSTSDGSSTANFTSNIIGLSPETVYNVRAYVTNEANTGYGSNISFRTLSQPVTSQASSISAAPQSSSAIQLVIGTPAAFPASGATQGGYVVIYATGTPTFTAANGTVPSAGVGSILATAAVTLSGGTPTTTINVTGLSQATAYNFLIIPYTWDGTNASTYNYLTATPPTASATTLANMPTLATPTAGSITSLSATLGATISSDGGGSITARGTVYKAGASGVAASDNPLAEGGTAVSAFSHQRSSLSPETRYYYAGYATNSAGTVLSTESNFYTLSAAPTQQAANFSGTGFSSSAIDLIWDGAVFPNSGASSKGYILLQATAPNIPSLSNANGTSPTAGANTTIINSGVPANATSYSVNSGLNAGTTYNYLLVPYTWDGTNAATFNYLTASAPTASAITLTTAPTASAATNRDALSFTANWSSVTGAASYQLDVATDNAFTSFVSGYNSLNVGNVTSLSVTVPSAEAIYYYRIRGVNASGASISSNPAISIITLSAVPTSAVTTFSASSVSSSQINLSWTAASFPGAGASATGYIILRRTDGANPTTTGVVAGTAPGSLSLASGTTLLAIISSGATTAYSNTGLSPVSAYNYLIVPFTWDGANASTYNYYSTGAPVTNATTQIGDLYTSGTLTWTTSNVWSTAQGGPYNTTTWSNGNRATFEGPAGTITVSSNVSTAGITVSTDGYAINANSSVNVTLTGTGSVNIATGTTSVGSSTNKVFGGTAGLNKSGSGELMLRTGLNLTGGVTVSGGTLTVGDKSNSLANPVSFLNGNALNLSNGKLTIAASSSSNSSITVSGITVSGNSGIDLYRTASSSSMSASLTTDGASFSTTNLVPLTLSSGSVFTIGAGGNTSGTTPAINFGSLSLLGNTTLKTTYSSTATTNLNIGGTGSNTAATTPNGGTITDNGNSLTVLGGGSASSDGGFVRFNTSGTLTGSWTIGASDGTDAAGMAVNNASALTSGAITVNANSQLRLNASGTNLTYSNTPQITLNGNGNSSTYGALYLNNGTSSGNPTTNLGSNIILNTSNAAITTINNAITGTYILTGSLTGAGGFEKEGNGVLVLASSANNFSGPTYVGLGTLTVNNGSSIGTGNLTMGQSVASFNTVLNLNNTAQTVGALSSSWTNTTGTFTQTINLGSGHTLTVNQSTNTTYGTGSVSTLTSILAGSGNLVKSGSGTLTLTSANTYTGTTTVSGGTLQLNRTGGTIPATNNVTVSGGTLQVSKTQTLNNLTITSGGLTVDAGVTLTINGSFVYDCSANITLGSGASIVYGAAATLTYDGNTTYTVTASEWPPTNGPKSVTVTNASTVNFGLVRAIPTNGVTVSSGGILAIGASGQLTGTGIITINNGGTLKVASTSASGAIVGNVPSGSVILNTGSTVEFNGGAAQFIAARTFSNLKMNNSFGASLVGAVTINGVLRLASGKVTLGTNNLTLGSVFSLDPSYSGSSTSYVVIDGTGSVIGNAVPASTTRIFPIGTTASYTPASVTPGANAGGLDWTVNVITGVAHTWYPDHAVNRTWNVSHSGAPFASGAGNGATLSFSYPAGDLGSALTTSSVLAVYHYKATAPATWELLGGSTSGPVNGLYTVTSPSDVIDFSPFAIGEANGILPVTFLTFSGKKEALGNVLKWSTVTEANNRGFTVERSTNGTTYTAIGFVGSKAAGGNSSNRIDYNFTDAAAPLKAWYRLQQEDLDGRKKQSLTIQIKGSAIPSLAISAIAPNPVRHSIVVNVDAPKRIMLTLNVTDLFGTTVATKAVAVDAGANALSLDMTKLSAGAYYLRAVAEDGTVSEAVKVIKQ